MKSVKIASLLLASGMLLGSVHSAVTPAYTAHAADSQVLVDESKRVKLEYGDVSVDANGIITSIIMAAPPTTENPNNSGMSMDKLMILFNGGELVIPKELINPETNAVTPITGIGANVFDKHNYPVGDKSGIAKLTFDAPENITSIGSNAFCGNTISGELDLENATTIGNSAFSGSQLTSIDLSNVQSVGNSAFEGNKLTSINLPKIEQIDSYAFSYNLIDKIELPADVEIEEDAFAEQYLAKNVNANEQGEVMTRSLLPSLKIGGKEQLTSLSDLYLGSSTQKLDLTDEKITMEDKSQHVTTQLWMDVNDADGRSDIYSIGWMVLGIYPAKTPLPTLPPTVDNNNEKPTTPDTTPTPPETTPEATPTPESPITISPDPEVNRPHTVYAKRAMRLHSNVSLTNPTKSYKKQSRAKAASFRIQGVSYDKNGKKRYKVKGGYITASTKYVADSHFRSSKVKQVRVIGNKVNSYKNAKLSKSQQVRSYKKGTKLKVKRIVKQGRTTRFQLNNGRYITGNKQLLIMDHSK